MITTAFSMTDAAGSASYSISPSSGSHKKGSNFTLSITENSSEQINGIDAKLSYDPSKLQFVSASTNGSPFDFCTDKSGGNGGASIVCVRLGGSVSGSQPVGSVTFKVLGGSGSTSVNFTNASHIVAVAGSQDVWNGSTSGGTYNLTSNTTSSSGGGSSSGSTSGSNTSPSNGGGTSSSNNGGSSTSASNSSTSPSSSGSSSSAGGGGSSDGSTSDPSNSTANVNQKNSNSKVNNENGKNSTIASTGAEKPSIKPLAVIIPAVLLIGIGSVVGVFALRSRRNSYLQKSPIPAKSQNPSTQMPSTAQSHTSSFLHSHPNAPAPGSVYSPGGGVTPVDTSSSVNLGANQVISPNTADEGVHNPKKEYN